MHNGISYSNGFYGLFAGNHITWKYQPHKVFIPSLGREEIHCVLVFIAIISSCVTCFGPHTYAMSEASGVLLYFITTCSLTSVGRGDNQEEHLKRLQDSEMLHIVCQFLLETPLSRCYGMCSAHLRFLVSWALSLEQRFLYR